MKGITIIILYWVVIILDIIVVEIVWFNPEPNYDLNLMNIWFIGLFFRLVFYGLVALWGFLGLLWVMEKLKIKL